MTIALVMYLLAQATIEPSLERHEIVPEKAVIGQSFCVLGAFGSRERHAWVFREFFLQHTDRCVFASMTKGKKGWILRLNGNKIKMDTISDSKAMKVAVMATEIVP